MSTALAIARTVRYAATRFGDIAYAAQGIGQAALFLHGAFFNGYFWRHIIDRIDDLRRCIAIDLLAHGATKTSRYQDVSFAAQADMIEAFCAALKFDRVDIVGNASGGAIAQIFAARYPQRIRSLTLTNCDVHDNWPPAALRETRLAVAQGKLTELGTRMLRDLRFARARFAVAYERPQELSRETVHTYLEPLFATPDAVRNLERWFIRWDDCSQTVVVEPLLRQLTAPTLVVWGTADPCFPLHWAHWLHTTIPGCRRVVELDGARLSFPEERPDELASALREHWQSVSRQ